MPPAPLERRWTLPAFVLFGLGAVAMRWAWIGNDLETLVATVLPDDAFYYFQIARSVWLGNGMTFDGATPATGMHPLWLLAVLPFFAGGEAAAAAPLRGVLVLCAVLTGLAATQIARVAWRVTGHAGAGIILGFAFLANPWVMMESMNGLETSLALALVATFAASLHGYLGAPGTARALGLGAIAALCVLARSDTAVVLLFPCALVVIARRSPVHPHVLLLAALPALAIVGLSLANYLLTGDPRQSSASAVPWVGRQNWLLFNPDAPALAFHRLGVGTAVVGVIKVVREMGWVVAALALAAGALALPALRRPAGGDTAARDALAILIAIAAGLLALHFVHGYFRWIVRTYYFAPWALLAFTAPAVAMRVWCPGALADLAAREATPRAKALGAALIALLVFQMAAGARRHVHYPWQVEMLRAGLEVRHRFPTHEPVGSFNSAIIAYVNDRPIVNLDGVVNEDAARAIRAGRLAAYIEERGIRRLVDSPAMWTRGAYFATLAPWFHPDGTPLAYDILAKIDTPGVGFPTPDGHIEIIELFPSGPRANDLE